MDHHHPFHVRPYGIRGRSRGYNSRGRDGRNESPRSPYIEISSDGESLNYSRLGTDNFGDPTICDSVFKSLKLLGEYSEDSEKKFVNDRSYISFILKKYLPDSLKKEKIVEIDLNIPDHEIEIYSGSGKLDLNNFLTWIVNNMEIFHKEMNLQDTTSNEGGRYVTTKKVLSYFVSIPYRYRMDMKFYAASVNGVIYLRKEYEADNGSIGKWAHKFEQCMTRENASDVVCNEDFRSVLSCSLGPHKLLYSASLDCANPEEFEDQFTDLSSFINLKCCEEADPLHYNHLMLHWYMNYVLSGVPKVLLGVRDTCGVVKRLQLYEASEMLELGKNLWNPVNCLVFTSKLLSFIKKRVESDPGAIFCIQKKPCEATYLH